MHLAWCLMIGAQPHHSCGGHLLRQTVSRSAPMSHDWTLVHRTAFSLESGLERSASGLLLSAIDTECRPRQRWFHQCPPKTHTEAVSRHSLASSHSSDGK